MADLHKSPDVMRDNANAIRITGAPHYDLSAKLALRATRALRTVCPHTLGAAPKPFTSTVLIVAVLAYGTRVLVSPCGVRPVIGTGR